MLLTRDRIFEVRERLGAKGDVIEPLVADDVANAVKTLVADSVEAVAVCFLFAYANPVHERAAAEIIRTIAPDLYLSLSHEVNPEWREYERTASTVANGYIGPPVSRYLRKLEELSLRRFPRSRALMMKSDGGAPRRPPRLEGGKRLSRPAGLALLAQAGGTVAAALSPLPRADDEIGWRSRKRAHAVGDADPDRHVGAGRRRDRRPPSGRRQGN